MSIYEKNNRQEQGVTAVALLSYKKMKKTNLDFFGKIKYICVTINNKQN